MSKNERSTSINESMVRKVKAESITKRAESQKQISIATGRFYAGAIDLLLDANSPEKSDKWKKLFDTLPPHLAPLYKKGFDRFNEELTANHQLIAQHRGDEILYLISVFMKSLGIAEDEIPQKRDSLSKYTEKVQFIEPTPGLAIIEASKAFGDKLKAEIGEEMNFHDFLFKGKNREEPSFVFTQKLEPDEVDDERTRDLMSRLERGLSKHEASHLVWHYLGRHEFLRKPEESTPETSNAFDRFRNEMVAYIVGNSDMLDQIRQLNIRAFTYSEDDEINRKAAYARDFAVFYIQQARKQGLEPSVFIYPSMTSQNFDELLKRYSDLSNP